MNRANNTHFIQCRRLKLDIKFEDAVINSEHLGYYIENGFTRHWFVFCGTGNSEWNFEFGGHPLWF